MARPKINRKNCKICKIKLNGTSKVYCLRCSNEKFKKWVELNKERYLEIHRLSDLEYQRKKRKRIIGYKTKEYRKYSEKNPEKVRAQQKLNIKIRNGEIKRSLCEVCGANKNIHGHHSNYLKFYEVNWLCPIHHKEIHLVAAKE